MGDGKKISHKFISELKASLINLYIEYFDIKELDLSQMSSLSKKAQAVIKELNAHPFDDNVRMADLLGSVLDEDLKPFIHGISRTKLKSGTIISCDNGKRLALLVDPGDGEAWGSGKEHFKAENYKAVSKKEDVVKFIEGCHFEILGITMSKLMNLISRE